MAKTLSSLKLTELNPDQQQAVTSCQGPLLVKAGPGTGKTLTLTTKIAYLLDQKIAKPKQIIALTFTNKAAGEMQQRVKNLTGRKRLPFMGTFHQFALNQLQLNAEQIVSESVQKRLIKKALKAGDFDSNQRQLKDAFLKISKYKNKAISQLSTSWKKIFQHYQQSLKKRDLVDFDDLLVQLLGKIKTHTHPESHYQFVLVDEFQDLNPIQYQIIKKLAARSDQLFVIGDPLQAIYGFRGADSQVFEQLQNDFSNLEILTLTKNYRSQQSILDLAHQLFPNQPKLQAERPGQTQPNLISTYDQYAEADWVISHLCQKMGGLDLFQASDCHQNQEAKADKNVRFSDFAVVYRTHHLSRALEKKLNQAGLPVQKLGNQSIYTQPEVKFVINLFKFIKDSIAFEPVAADPLIKISDQGLDQLNHLAQALNQDLYVAAQEMIGQKILSQSDKNKLSQLLINLKQIDQQQKSLKKKSLVSLTENIIKQFDLSQGSNQRANNLRQFKSNLVRFENQNNQLDKFLAYLDQISAQEYYDYQADKISLLTMHSAKGLEFDYVYLIGFEQGYVPLKKAEDEVDLEEEKRLLYVALTRAKKGLYLLKTEQRFKQEVKSSVFEKSLKPKLIEKKDPNLAKIKKRIKKKEQAEQQKSLF
jgi:DNA helicase II / ATP-dependent DNA helicase PcrA